MISVLYGRVGGIGLRFDAGGIERIGSDGLAQVREQALDAVGGGGVPLSLAGPAALVGVLGTLQSLTRVALQDLPEVSLAPLATLPHLRELYLQDMEEPVDLSPLAQTDHRLRVHLRDTTTVGDPGPLVKIRKIL